MIRQSFYPRQQIRKKQGRSKAKNENSQNQKEEKEPASVSSKNIIFIEQQFTEPMEQKAHKKRCNSMIRPIRSTVLQSKNSNREKSTVRHFLLESRRKIICSPVQRSISTSHNQARTLHLPRNRHCSTLQNIELTDLRITEVNKKSMRKKKRIPLSMRAKASLPWEGRLQSKVKGWETYNEDFVDFMN